MESLTRKIFVELMFALARIAKFGFLLSMDVEIIKPRFWDTWVSHLTHRLTLFLCISVLVGFGLVSAQTERSTIVLGPIEGELEKKQFLLIWAIRQKHWCQLLPRSFQFTAVCVWLRRKVVDILVLLAPLQLGHIRFDIGGESKALRILFTASEGSVERSTMKACDLMVRKILVSPASFPANYAFSPIFRAKKKFLRVMRYSVRPNLKHLRKNNL